MECMLKVNYVIGSSNACMVGRWTTSWAALVEVSLWVTVSTLPPIAITVEPPVMDQTGNRSFNPRSSSFLLQSLLMLLFQLLRPKLSRRKPERAHWSLGWWAGRSKWLVTNQIHSFFKSSLGRKDPCRHHLPFLCWLLSNISVLSYNDARNDYVMNEVALDYNSGFQMAVAGLLNDVVGQDLDK